MKNESLKFLDKVKRYDEKCGSALADKVCGRSNQKENNIINISKKKESTGERKGRGKLMTGFIINTLSGELIFVLHWSV